MSSSLLLLWLRSNFSAMVSVVFCVLTLHGICILAAGCKAQGLTARLAGLAVAQGEKWLSWACVAASCVFLALVAAFFLGWHLW